MRSDPQPPPNRDLVIVDTNVLVGGLMQGDAPVSVVRIVDGMRTAAFAFVISEAVLAEYRDVLARPEIVRRHGPAIAAPGALDAVLATIVSNAIVVEPVPGRRAPDPGDQFLWDLLAARDDLLLATSDRLLLKDAGMRGRVLTPVAFVDRIAR